MIQRRRQPRSGFTLIELLAVIAILLTLSALSLSAVFKALQLVRRGNTERTMEKVFKRFDARLTAIANLAKSGEVPEVIVSAATYPSGAPLTLENLACSSVAGGAPTLTDPELERKRLRVVYLKLLTKQSFPMNYVEIRNNALMGNDTFAIGLYQRLQNQCTNQISPGVYRAIRPETESAACLGLIYAQLGSTDDLAANEFIDTDGDGVPEIIDAWGRPLRLYRWPHDASNRVPKTFYNWQTNAAWDPADPELLLGKRDLSLGVSPWNATQRGFFAIPFHPVDDVATPPPPTIPTAGDPGFGLMQLVSAGPDGRFGFVNADAGAALTQDAYDGMVVPPLAAAQNDELDNFYSFRFRLGATTQGQ